MRDNIPPLSAGFFFLGHEDGLPIVSAQAVGVGPEFGVGVERKLNGGFLAWLKLMVATSGSYCSE